MWKAEPHLVVHHELQLTVVTIVVVLGILLGLKKTFANLHKENIVVIEKCRGY